MPCENDVAVSGQLALWKTHGSWLRVLRPVASWIALAERTIRERLTGNYVGQLQRIYSFLSLYRCRISTPYLLVVASLASTFSDLRARFRSTKLRVRSGIGDIQFRRTRPTCVRGNPGTFRDNSVATTLIYAPNKQRISSSAIRLFGTAIAREERLFVWNGVTNGTVARTCARKFHLANVDTSNSASLNIRRSRSPRE